MNKNETSLVSHALNLYELQYNDNIKLTHYSYINRKYIEVSDHNLQNNSVILRVYRGIGYMSYEAIINTSSNLNNNIHSFINHWLRCYNINEKINHVAVRECSDNTLDIVILCRGNCWYWILESQHRSVEDWISYNW